MFAQFSAFWHVVVSFAQAFISAQIPAELVTTGLLGLVVITLAFFVITVAGTQGIAISMAVRSRIRHLSGAFRLPDQSHPNAAGKIRSRAPARVL